MSYIYKRVETYMEMIITIYIYIYMRCGQWILSYFTSGFNTHCIQIIPYINGLVILSIVMSPFTHHNKVYSAYQPNLIKIFHSHEPRGFLTGLTSVEEDALIHKQHFRSVFIWQHLWLYVKVSGRVAMETPLRVIRPRHGAPFLKTFYEQSNHRVRRRGNASTDCGVDRSLCPRNYLKY